MAVGSDRRALTCAALVAGAVGTLAAYPFHTLRTLQQVSTSASSPSVLYLTQCIVRREGFLRGLYRGWPAQALLFCPASVLYYQTYYASRRWLAGTRCGEHVVADFLAGNAAIFAGTILWTPMDNICQRVMVSRASSASAVRDIFATGGWRGLFRGYCATIAVWAPCCGTFFAAYELLKSKFPSDSVGGNLACSTLAATAGVAMTNPLDIVRTRFQLATADSKTPGAFRTNSALRFGRHVWQLESLPSLMTRGLGPRLVAIVPDLAVGIIILEAVYWHLHLKS